MLVTRQKVLRKFWYPVLREGDLDDGPVPFTLLGEKIVLWRDAGGEAVCIKDRCCHRTAQLSRGFIEDGNIVCGYHGWTYDGAGRCVRIPQQPPDADIIEDIKVPAYHCEIRYGHVWVALEEPLTGIPDIPEDNEGFRRIDQFYEEWTIGAFRLMENSFDPAHVNFTHRGTFGNQGDDVYYKPEITDLDFGFKMYVEMPVVNRGTAFKYLGDENAGDENFRRMDSNWFMPFVRRLGISYPTGLKHTIITAATPITDDRSMIIQFCYRSDTEDDVKAEDIIAFDRDVTLEDKRILETTEFDVPLDNSDPREFHMATDLPGLRMRRRLKELFTEFGEEEETGVSA